MANHGVTGRVVDGSGQGIAGLVVGVRDLRSPLPGRFLNPVPALPLPGLPRTDATGAFTVSYAPRQLPDLVIDVFDPVLRRLPSSLHVDGRSKVFADVQLDVLPLPEAIVVDRADMQHVRFHLFRLNVTVGAAAPCYQPPGPIEKTSGR